MRSAAPCNMSERLCLTCCFPNVSVFHVSHQDLPVRPTRAGKYAISLITSTQAAMYPQGAGLRKRDFAFFQGRLSKGGGREGVQRCSASRNG